MPYEVLVDRIDYYATESVKLHQYQQIDPAANILGGVRDTRAEARELAEFYGRNGFWQNGHRFIGPAQIAAVSIRLVPSPKRRK